MFGELFYHLIRCRNPVAAHSSTVGYIDIKLYGGGHNSQSVLTVLATINSNQIPQQVPPYLTVITENVNMWKQIKPLHSV